MDTQLLEVRLIRVVLDSGEIEVLATKLMDEQAYPSNTFKELYYKRWQMEGAYKLFSYTLYATGNYLVNK